MDNKFLLDKMENLEKINCQLNEVLQFKNKYNC